MAKSTLPSFGQILEEGEVICVRKTFVDGMMAKSTWPSFGQILEEGEVICVRNTFVDVYRRGPCKKRSVSLPVIDRLCPTLAVSEAEVSTTDGSDGSDSSACEEPQPQVTCMMLRNIPNFFNRAMLEELLDEEGFERCYNFIYLPAELSKRSCFGWAFINLVTPSVAQSFYKHFNGFKWPGKAAAVEEGRGHGVTLATLIDRYRNSPIMHESVPDDLRPTLYENGVRIPFPEASAELEAPLTRRSKRQGASRRKKASKKHDQAKA